MPSFVPCKGWVSILEGAINCLPPPVLLAGKAQLPPWKMNPLASSFLGNRGAQWRAYASVLVGDTCGPLCHQLKEKASLPNKESRTGVHTAHKDVVTSAGRLELQQCL